MKKGVVIWFALSIVACLGSGMIIGGCSSATQADTPSHSKPLYSTDNYDVSEDTVTGAVVFREHSHFSQTVIPAQELSSSQIANLKTFGYEPR